MVPQNCSVYFVSSERLSFLPWNHKTSSFPPQLIERWPPHCYSHHFRWSPKTKYRPVQHGVLRIHTGSACFFGGKKKKKEYFFFHPAARLCMAEQPPPAASGSTGGSACESSQVWFHSNTTQCSRTQRAKTSGENKKTWHTEPVKHTLTHSQASSGSNHSTPGKTYPDVLLKGSPTPSHTHTHTHTHLWATHGLHITEGCSPTSFFSLSFFFSFSCARAHTHTHSYTAIFVRTLSEQNTFPKASNINHPD